MVQNLVYIPYIAHLHGTVHITNYLLINPPTAPLSDWSLTWENLIYFLTTPSPLSPQPGSEISAAKADQFSRVAFLPTPPSQLPVAASPFLALLTSSPYLKTWNPCNHLHLRANSGGMNGSVRSQKEACLVGSPYCNQDDPVK